MTNMTAMEGVTEALNKDAVHALAASEPDWLQDRRREAWGVYEATPMPTTRLEEWRYTDLRRKLNLAALKLSGTDTAPDDMEAWPTPLREAMAQDRDASGHIVVIDGHVVHADLDAGLAQKGVVLESLHEAVKNSPCQMYCAATHALFV